MVNDTEMMTTSKSALFILNLSRLASYHKRPNARRELRQTAGARHERTLGAVLVQVNALRAD
jgi:hypothetical protein